MHAERLPVRARVVWKQRALPSDEPNVASLLYTRISRAVPIAKTGPSLSADGDQTTKGHAPRTHARASHHQLYPKCLEKDVNRYGMCPTSPSSRQLTDPVGRIVRYVSEQLKGQNRSHASGGSCRALQKKLIGRTRGKVVDSARRTGKKKSTHPCYEHSSRTKHAPADKVPDDVGVAHDDLELVVLLDRMDCCCGCGYGCDICISY